MKPAFGGHLNEIRFICIDNFKDWGDIYAYFLTHFHGDHICGIDDFSLLRLLKRKNIYIYTSEVTVAIITARYPHLTPHLKSLRLGRNALSIPTRDKEEFLEVTVLPAGHSLGSVMYLFEYENQKILFTGDFRISKNDVAKYKHLQNNGEPIQIDALYVDTTFQDKPYIPKRSEVVSNLIPHINKWLAENEKNKVVLSVSAMFGYEGACNQIYDEIKIKANVNEDDWAIYRQFPKQIYGVTNEESRIALRKKNKERIPKHTLDVVFSAFSWRSPNLDEKFLVKEGLQRIKVCYSTHCGRDELIHFINYLKPRRIKGFPEDLKENNSKLSFCSIFTNKDSDANENFDISPKKRKIVRDNDDKENCKKSDVVKRKLADVLDW
ncbi:protein artemis-like isoform X1 [Spodoptera litura]|uniref:Protein artemis n=1 Tax=Spodoptera litura TaxID=69820 RepID=A0A9J7EJM4_SPOLT|nr:protein artemis-like isoform X1 [Spodoptera litura]